MDVPRTHQQILHTMFCGKALFSGEKHKYYIVLLVLETDQA